MTLQPTVDGTASPPEDKSLPSVFGGAMIIAGTSIGAGMFSLPVISAGMWFGYGILLLLFAWYCMYSSGLMLLETNLHFAHGSSFDTHTRETLGHWARIVNGLSVTFVLYILTYAYVSGGSSILAYTLAETLGVNWPQWLCGLVFGLTLAAVVCISTRSVDRITTIMLAVMVICFAMAMVTMMDYVTPTALLPADSISYWPYTFMALPFMLTSFGYHGNVPSLVKYYQGNAQAVRQTLLYGSLIALACYILWLTTSLGVLGRGNLPAIIAAGGNMGVVVGAIEAAVNNDSLQTVLKTFSNIAVASSFLGVTLGLFDYIADTFKFQDTASGRIKTALITFTPPIALGIIFPDGFIMAIGFAAIAATLFAVIIPALMVIAARRKLGPTTYRVPGGWPRLIIVILFGVLVILFHILSIMKLLPQFG
ncbi:aromatic amino acid transporter [Endozoicomonas sp. Mp262]|uniref:aromatic amino acid transporter n=1 Tax=Endozoicomonas sp. Mp262 TaxID=2919499 RepID=UPI0021D9AECF